VVRINRQVPRLSALLIAGAALTSGLAPTTFAQPQQPGAVDTSLAPYASTRDSARLPDGRIIHIVCMGRGSPVVILTAGAGGWGIVWNKVQPAVAEKTRVCAWDRAGFGLSQLSPEPQTVDNTTTDLEVALKAGNIGGPYVVVGHSLGGLESLLLADRQPRNVVGMVLVDPTVPDQTERFKRVAPGLSRGPAQENPAVALFHKCAAALRAGTVKAGGPDPDGCLRPPASPPEYPPELRAALNKRPSELSAETVASAMDFLAASASPQWLEADTKIAIKPERNYGDMPLIVLTAGETPSLPGQSDAVNAERSLQQAEFRRAHDDLAALSTRGVNRVVADSSHYIQQIRPQVVIDSIDEVVDEARADMAKPRKTTGR
jgi:pimeloyl-ACP methyl ester carboxylesterase